MHNTTDRMYPVLKSENRDFLIDPNKLEPIVVNVNGIALHTAPIVFGKQFNLLALCEHELLSHPTDEIQAPLYLESAFISIDDQIFPIHFNGLNGINALRSLEAGARMVVINLKSFRCDITENTLDVEGRVLKRIADDPSLKIELSMDITGSLSITTGNGNFECRVNVNNPEVAVSVVPEGFILDAHRHNVNVINPPHQPEQPKYRSLILGPVKTVSTEFETTEELCTVQAAESWAIFGITHCNDTVFMYKCADQSTLLKIIQNSPSLRDLPAVLRIEGIPDVVFPPSNEKAPAIAILPGVESDNGEFKMTLDGNYNRWAVVLYNDDHTFVQLGVFKQYIHASFVCGKLLRTAAAF